MAEKKITLKPKDVKPSLIKRLEVNYGPVDMKNDFFSKDLDTYYKTSNINKETGQLTHNVINLASFGDSLKRMSDAVKALKVLMTTDEANNDQNIKDITRELKDVFNKYRSHLRTNYPDQYDEIRRQLEEMSTTGGGAGAASFSGGTGMQYATPYAFRRKGQKANDKAYKELGYTDIKEEKTSTVSKSRAKSSLKQIKKGKRDDGMGKFDAKVFAVKDGKEIELKTQSDLDKHSTGYEYILKENIGAHLGPGPVATEDGVKDNAYVKQFKYKLVPKNKNGNYVQKGSGLEVKQLFEAESASEFQKKRITAFDQIEQELNNIYKMLSNAKNETVEYYNDNESSYSVVKPTDLVLDYIKDIKDLLK
jgi:hypothetical protein